MHEAARGEGFRFPHETLEVYRLAVAISAWVRELDWPRGDGALGDQARRASASVVLNIAEGHARVGKARAHHLGIARASAAEVCAVLDVVRVGGGDEVQEKLRRVALMLVRLDAALARR